MTTVTPDEQTTIRVFVVAFENGDSAEQGMQALSELNLSEDQMMLIASSDDPALREALPEAPAESAAQGALVGTAVGGVLGLLGSISLVPITGLGSLFASGLVGSVSGVTIGSYLGAIYNARFASEIELKAKDILADGGVLLLVDEKDLPQESHEIEKLMKDQGALLAEVYEIDAKLLEKAQS